MDSHATGIKSTNLNAAMAQADQVKAIAARSVDKMNANLDETEKLLANSQDINMIAKDFQKNAHTLEQEQKKGSWWYCSRPCVILFSVLGVLLVVLFIVLKLK